MCLLCLLKFSVALQLESAKLGIPGIVDPAEDHAIGASLQPKECSLKMLDETALHARTISPQRALTPRVTEHAC